MQKEHTPGPWQHWPTGFDNSARAFGPHGKCPIGKTLGDAEETNEANARLIASAPEILSALESLMPLLDADLDAVQNWQAEANNARAAITKAKGGVM